MKKLAGTLILSILSLNALAEGETSIFNISGTARSGWNNIVSNSDSNEQYLKVCISRHFNILTRKGKLNYDVAGNSCQDIQTDSGGNFSVHFTTGSPSHKKHETAVATATYIYAIHGNADEGESFHMTPLIISGKYDNTGGTIEAEFQDD